MNRLHKIGRASVGTALAAALAISVAASIPSRAGAQPAGAAAPTNDLTLSVGAGRLVQLPGAAADVFVANDTVADVYIRSNNQIFVFGKGTGQTSVYATDRAGRVLYSANVRVGSNLGSVDELLRLAMPEADIRATPMAGTVLLTGTVRQPADVEEAQRLVQAFVGEGTQVISRLRTATPMQVMLQVRIAEVNRSLLREIGTNITTRDTSGGDISFGLFRGNAGSFNDDGSAVITRPEGTNVIGLAARNVLGLDVLGALNLNETNGLVTTLAEPTLSALSGETASFLAGGEFPIPSAQGIGGTSIEFKQYGVSLAFTPVVLEGGRISMRVRPEVSELSTEGAIRLNGFTVPSLVTRRAETTVELGSGQSFMIAGLLRNTNSNSVDRVPALGRLPVIGALFRSNGFRRNETELVIIVTPYLVRPVNARDIALPIDGFRSAGTADRVMGDRQHNGVSGEQRPGPTAGPPQTIAPGIGPVGAAVPPQQPRQAPRQQASRQPQQQPAANAPSPGFNF
ncbi:MAG TPA: type II and III secretion system protein family protein [Allosphingosinicella sp.]|jgi:pilus assembly protein CpaC